jgi:hypothetical protein
MFGFMVFVVLILTVVIANGAIMLMKAGAQSKNPVYALLSLWMFVTIITNYGIWLATAKTMDLSNGERMLMAIKYTSWVFVPLIILTIIGMIKQEQEIAEGIRQMEKAERELDEAEKELREKRKAAKKTRKPRAKKVAPEPPVEKPFSEWVKEKNEKEAARKAT